jgi:23S rRNA (cytidine1920-2'-O)/16S rRNA (cytidine1409-2'-O)-methyltransferase
VRRRLDAELVRRGLVSSRTEAAELVRSGRVRVAGRPTEKPASLVAPDEPLVLEPAPNGFVSRGGRKLDAALGGFGVSPSGRHCLDAGASTGGFTDCLLRQGAAAVVAVDVGYGQLAWELRTDPRVTVLERTNIRDLRAADLPFPPDLVVADLSFISLRTVLPSLAAVAGERAEFIVLVKPQFEAGRSDVGKGGVVRDPEVWRRVLADVAAAFVERDLAPRAAMASPILGPSGNAEFLLYAVRGGAATQLDLGAAVDEARRLREAS